jgi:hypothetical protein
MTLKDNCLLGGEGISSVVDNENTLYTNYCISLFEFGMTDPARVLGTPFGP